MKNPSIPGSDDWCEGSLKRLADDRFKYPRYHLDKKQDAQLRRNLKTKKARCPECNRRLLLTPIFDHYDNSEFHGVQFPWHKRK